mgnify:FL=1
MQYSTEIDSIGLKCEFNRASVQRDKLSGLKSYINSIVGLSVIPKERIIGYGATILEYYVYYKNITIAIIKTGAYRANKSIEENTYYINIVSAGLKSYDDCIDEIKHGFLLSVCSWFNTKRIVFTIRELDCNIDANCSYINFHVMQVRSSPNRRFNANEEQMFTTTRYLQRKSKYKSTATSALYYDKQVKENLDEELSRCEFKFVLKKEHTISMDSLYKKISNGFNRYAVYYFSNLKLKEDVIRAQNQIEAYGVNKARAYDNITKQIDLYRLYPNIDYIISYIERLFTIRNYKMIIQDKDFIDLPIDTTNRLSGFEGMFD